MRKLALGIAAFSLATFPVALPTAANAQSASDLGELCHEIVDNGGGGYKNVGDCVSEIRGRPVDMCQFIKLHLGFPALIEAEDGAAALVESQGDCISHYRKHGGVR